MRFVRRILQNGGRSLELTVVALSVNEIECSQLYFASLCLQYFTLSHLFLSHLLSAQCVSIIGQIIKSVCVSVSECVSE